MGDRAGDCMTAPFVIHHGECLEVLRTLPDCSIDSICTDPPYGLSFMGKKWDYDVPSVDVWVECLRVLKPGGYLLSFGGTRTYHRLATRIEDAGFTLHPMLGWLFGQGFPKATRVELPGMDGYRYGLQSLKPALEPICMAQKPFSEKTGTANIAQWGTGALNIDACRVPAEAMPPNTGAGGMPRRHPDEPRGPGLLSQPHNSGRWPANVIIDGSDEVLAAFPQTSSGVMKAGTVRAAQDQPGSVCYGTFGGNAAESDTYGDKGSAARFFYAAKASKEDRGDMILIGYMPRARNARKRWQREQWEGRAKRCINRHPTVKPTTLLKYLCRLITPPGGKILDMYCGSGSTGKAAILEGFSAILIEREAQSVATAKARCEHAVATVLAAKIEAEDLTRQAVLL